MGEVLVPATVTPVDHRCVALLCVQFIGERLLTVHSPPLTVNRQEFAGVRHFSSVRHLYKHYLNANTTQSFHALVHRSTVNGQRLTDCSPQVSDTSQMSDTFTNIIAIQVQRNHFTPWCIGRPSTDDRWQKNIWQYENLFYVCRTNNKSV